MNAEQRFWSRVEFDPNGGCWFWTGALSKGYGHIRDDAGRDLPAHRYAYETFVGPVERELVTDHLCRVRCCVNPAHLEIVTNTENVMRGDGLTARKARATHCERGHLFTPESTIIDRRGRRACRICKLAGMAAWNAAHPDRWARYVANRAFRLNEGPHDV